ncbi:MAG: lipopolysaccharide assembly protein LapA domain-containing protein [Sphingomonas sp.]|jgi:uncharacterized integral membrane protein
MQFLKTLFWVLLAIIVAVFAANNWKPVQILLWAGLVAEINLPLLLLLSFLAGFLPVLLVHHAVKWRLRHRLGMAERTVEELRTTIVAASTQHPGQAEITDEPVNALMPVLTAVPPGVA